MTNNKQQTAVEFIPFHTQMDYETNVVEVQYEGEFNEEKAIEYAKESYPNINGEVLYLSKPNETKGYINLGVVGIK
jgi:hypothetical protein